jgi:hypothetical protein
MIETGLAVAKAGSTVGAPVIGLVMRQLEDGEREQIRKSFAQALAWSLANEEERAATSKGGSHRVRRGLGSELRRLGKRGMGVRSKTREHRRAEAARDNRARGAIVLGAEVLTRAWTQGFAQFRTGRTEEAADWIVMLRACIEKTARSGALATSGNRAEWRYLIKGKWDQAPTNPEILEWSGLVATEVVSLWRERPKLAGVIAQLNAESGLGVQQALLLASREVSRSVRWIALSVTSLAILGGGGVTLLVLFLDKG